MPDNSTRTSMQHQHTVAQDYGHVPPEYINELSSADIHSIDVPVFARDISNAIDKLAESARFCISVLDQLKTAHPYISGALLAFEIVINLELKRRETSAKVKAVYAQMTNMMFSLCQLQKIVEDTKVIKGPDGKPLIMFLEFLTGQMTESVKEGAAFCDMYGKKRFLSKCLKAPVYESRLAFHATRYKDLRDELSFCISLHINDGINSVNKKLDNMQLQMQKILQHFDTPREREVRNIIKKHGGAKACVQNPKVLKELVDTEQNEDQDGSSSTMKRDIDISQTRDDLLKDLSENIDSAIKKNLYIFSGKLDIQRKEIGELKHQADLIKRQGDQIMAYISGWHGRIFDEQLSKIWKEMGWKSTVKARHFVLALRDFFMGELGDFKQSKGTPLNAAHEPKQLVSPPSLAASGDSDPDEWAKSYINVTYLQSILEAIDDDGSAFINITEVNTFALSRPAHWTLLQWLAYWAAGWQSGISNYKNKIYRTLRKLFKLLQKARPDNQCVLDGYLHDFSFRLDLLLRSTTTTVESGVSICPQLAKLTEEFTNTEEKKLRENLESVSYIIDSTATVSLITGPGRIERYIYPLLYLLLERHIKIFQLARKHIFHLNEMETCSKSLLYVFSAFNNRLQDLTAIFKHMHLQVERQFEIFAFGMFKRSYGDLTWDISEITLRSVWEDLPEEPGDREGLAEVPDDIPIDILKYGPQKPFDLVPPVPFEVIVQPDDGPNIIQGNWAGYTTWSDGNPHEGLFRIVFNETSEDGTTTGKADGYIGPLEMSASVIPATEGSSYRVDFVMVYNDGYWIRCIGTLDTAAAKISGQWYGRRVVTELKPVPGSKNDNYSRGTFELYRTPADLVRFRYSKKAFEENRARARWVFACAAIRFIVQRRFLTPGYVVSQLKQGRRFKELTIKQFTLTGGNTQRTVFTPEEMQELREIETTICPYVDQFYYSIARFTHTRITRYLGVTCDLCGRKIQQSRLICIVCRTNDSLDLCIECHSAESVPGYEAHTGSHSLLRGDRFLHDCNRAWAMPIARKTSERLKEAFRSQAAIERSQSDNQDESIIPREKDEATNSLFKCFFCEDVISLPCWVCLECPGDVLVCDNCDKLNQYPKLPEKLVTTPPTLVHMMLRITNDKSVEIHDDEQFGRLEQKLTGVTNRVDERLDLVDNRLAEVTLRVDERFNRLWEMTLAKAKEQESRRFDQFGVLAGDPQIGDSAEHHESRTTGVQVSSVDPKNSAKTVEHRLGLLEAKVEEKFDSMQGQFESLKVRFATVESLLRDIALGL